MLLTITTPDQPGDFLPDIDLAQEGIAWFGSQGNTPIRILVYGRWPFQPMGKDAR
jgi:hypothetical protein